MFAREGSCYYQALLGVLELPRRMLSRFLQLAPLSGKDRTEKKGSGDDGRLSPCQGVVSGINSSQSLSSGMGFQNTVTSSSRLRENTVEARPPIQSPHGSASSRVGEGLHTS